MIEKPIAPLAVANKLGYFGYKAHPKTGVLVRHVELGKLCKYPSINMWSKRKPIQFPGPGELTAGDFATKNYGLKPPTPTTNYVTAVGQKWEYQRPYGTAASVYRISDFDNYYHGAMPVARIGRKEIAAYRSTNSTVTVSLVVNPSQTNQIGLGDLTGDVGAYFFGVVFDKGGTKYIQTARRALNDTTSPGSSDSFELNILHPYFSSGSVLNIDMYYVLCETKVERISNLSANRFLAIPSAEGEDNVGSLRIFPAGTQGISTHDLYVGTAAGQTNPISNYNNMLGDAFTTRGNLYLGIELRATGTAMAAFQTDDLTISLDTNYFGVGMSLPVGIFTPIGVPITSTINVYPNSPVLVYIGGPDIVNRMANGVIADPPSNTEIFPSIRIYRRGFQITSTSLKLIST